MYDRNLARRVRRAAAKQGQRLVRSRVNKQWTLQNGGVNCIYINYGGTDGTTLEDIAQHLEVR